jgi:DNA-binding CsgD family transcriptional regulator
MERFQLRDSRFYRDVLQPHGVLDMLWFPALRTGSRMASMHASRGDTLQPYRTEDVRLFELLAPHVCRALAISDALDIRVLRSEMLERTLDGLATGVFLMAGDGHVVHMNAAAERQARSGTAVRVVNNRLFPVYPAARAVLDAAIRDTAQDGAHWEGKEHSIALPGLAHGGAVATLLPVAEGRRAGVLAPFAAAVAVFVQDHVDTPLMPGEAFGRLYGLTGGELRVVMALSQGLGGMESAQALGVSEPTIRTHLQRIFSKTGTSKQADLLRLMHQSTPPTRPKLEASA